MKVLVQTCDLCDEQHDTHRYGNQDICSMCKLDIDQFMMLMRRIRVHKLWPKYHAALKPLIWNEDWLPEKVDA